LESIHKRGVAEEHPNSHLIQLLAAIIFFLIWILDSFIFTYSTILAIYIQFTFRFILFLSVLTIGLLLIFLAGHLLFHKKDTTPKLLKTGIFAHTRHPIYLGVLILYIGFILLSISLISIIGFIIAFILYNWIAKYEEKNLEKIFQEEYTEYKKNVHRWISF
jgi:protein-S-isoprenylcysteine O-methyltransferase Ste14